LGDGDVQRPAIGKGDAPHGAEDGVLEADLQLRPDVLPPAAETAAGPGPGAGHAAEHAEQVVQIDALEARAEARPAGRAAAPPAGEAAKLLAAVRVDLAAIEFPALLLVPEDVERPGHPLETFLGFRIAGIAVRVQLLGQLAEGLADLVLAGVSGDAKFLVGIARHSSVSLRFQTGLSVKRSEERRVGK